MALEWMTTNTTQPAQTYDLLHRVRVLVNGRGFARTGEGRAEARDRNFDLGRLSIRRDHRPHEHRLAGGGVPADSFVRLEGRGTGGPRGGSDAGGGQSVAPVGPPPTPTVPAWWRGVRAPLRGPAARRRTGVGRVTPLGSRGPASMGGSAARRAPHGRRGSGGG